MNVMRLSVFLFSFLPPKGRNECMAWDLVAVRLCCIQSTLSSTPEYVYSMYLNGILPQPNLSKITSVSRKKSDYHFG